MFAATCYLLVAMLNFLVMPYTLRILGKPVFGAWQILMTIFSYSAFLDFGISTALAKYVAEYNARNDEEAVNAIANTGLVSYLTISVAGTLFLLLISKWFLRWLLSPSAGGAVANQVGLLDEVSFGYYWVVAITFTMVVGKSFRMILIGMQKLYLINTIEIAVQIPAICILVFLLHGGYGFRGFVELYFFQYAIVNALLVYYSLKTTSGFRINLFAASSMWFKKMCGFGWKTSLPGVSTVIQSQIERLALARFGGLEVVAMWAFGAKLVDVVRLSVTPAINMVMPAASELSVSNTGESLRSLHKLGTKFLIVALFPLGWLIFATAPLFITAWLGAGYDDSVLSLRFLIIAAINHLTFSVAANVARGKGRTSQDLVSSVVLVAAELVLVLVLGRRFGYIGILTSTLIAYTLCSLTTFVVVYKAERISVVSSLIRVYGPPYVLSVIAALPVIWVNYLNRVQITNHAAASHRYLYLGRQALLQTVVFLVIYAVMLRVSGYMKQDEVRTLRQAMRAAGLRRRVSTV